MHKVITFIIFILFEFCGFTQESNTLFFMNSVPQSNLLNPAIQIPCKIFIGMPLLSSVNTDYSNTFFNYNDIISKSSNGNLNLNHYFLNNIPQNTNQEVFLEFQISLLNFGFIYKKFYFNFNLSDKMDAGISYPTNLFILGLLGNRNFEGETMNLGGLKVYCEYYREWAFGVSEKINDKLTLGVKAKLLFGKVDMQTSESDLGISTGLTNYPLNFTTHYTINISPILFKIEPNGRIDKISLPSGISPVSLFLNSQNKGLAIDFGAIYKLSDDITLSGSLLDLGGIYWKYSPSQVSISGQFPFNGILFDPATGGFRPFSKLLDTLVNSYKFVSNTTTYFQAIAPKLYLGGTFELVHNLNTGLLFRNELFQGKLLFSSTASFNAWYNRYVGGSISWSYMNGSLANLGLGLSARSPQFGFYAVSDNVYGMLKWKSAQLLNIRFGFNFLFGCSSSKKIKGTGCAIYVEADKREKRYKSWIERLKKEKNKKSSK